MVQAVKLRIGTKIVIFALNDYQKQVILLLHLIDDDL